MGNNKTFLAHPIRLQKLGINPVPEHNHSQLPETLFLPATASTHSGGTPKPPSRGRWQVGILRDKSWTECHLYSITHSLLLPFLVYKAAKCYLLNTAINLLLSSQEKMGLPEWLTALSLPHSSSHSFNSLPTARVQCILDGIIYQSACTAPVHRLWSAFMAVSAIDPNLCMTRKHRGAQGKDISCISP